MNVVTTVQLTFSFIHAWLGGNQREQDRLKAQKKAAGQKKPKESATNLAKRKEADAEALRAKQKKKEEEKATASSSGANK
ncbi:hypothetical protein PQX77_012742 [Marasmius sp. AFHP31]|nr:hypothetical protein PQX77_012742 [Marasmius sp. AFHP31]